MTIGVIDTDIDYENTEIAANIDTEHMRNEVDDTIGANANMKDEYAKGEYDDGKPIMGTHDTQVAAVASAITGDVYGCDGASYNAKIVPVKVTDSNGDIPRGVIADAYRYLIELDNPPDVINISIGAAYFSKGDALSQSGYKTMQDLVDRAWKKGVVTVAGSGNDGSNLAEGSMDSEWSEEKSKDIPVNGYTYPACLNHVVSIGALDAPGLLDSEGTYTPHLADFSNTNSDVDIAAYGVNIHVPNAYHNANHEVLDWFTTVRGTSFSAPQVASAIALVKAKNNDFTAQEAIEAVKKTASSVDEADSSNPRKGYGAGALDAAAAVKWKPGGSSGSGSSGSSGESGSSGSSGESGGALGGSIFDAYREAMAQ